MKRNLRLISMILVIAMIASMFTFVSVANCDTADGRFVFNNTRTAAYLKSEHNTNMSFNASEKAVVLAPTSTNCDPWVFLDVASAANLSADVYKYVVITYRSTASNTNRVTELYPCAGSITAPTGDCYASTYIRTGNNYKSNIVDLSALSNWAGQINQVRFDYYQHCEAGEVYYLSSIVFATDAENATEIANERTAAANTTYGEKVVYDYKSDASVKAITSSNGSALLGDVNDDGRIGMKDVLTLKKHVGGISVEINLSAADVNGDGRVGAADVLRLKKYLAGVPGNELAGFSAKVTYSADNTAACITAKDDAPELKVAFNTPVDTNQFSYVVLSYMLPATQNNGVTLTYSNGHTETLNLKADGQFHAIDFSYYADNTWTGKVSSVNIATSLDKDETIYIDSFTFTEYPADASAAIAEREKGIESAGYDALIFDNAADTAYFLAPHSTSISFDAAQQDIALAVVGTAGDPFTTIDYSQSVVTADQYKYIIFTYMVPAAYSAKVTAGNTELFLSAGSIAGATAGYSKTFVPVCDGKYHAQIISLTDTSFWNGKINNIRIDYFSSCTAGNTMYLDSICLAEGKSDAVIIAQEREAAKNGTGSSSSYVTTALSYNDAPATANIYNATSVNNGTASFDGGMMMVLDANHNTFNRFSFNYSTNTIVRGIAYYDVGGVEVADEFFLENTNGATQTFNSIIVPYFSNLKASGIKMIELYTIKTSSAAVKISSITEEEIPYIEQTTYYLENDVYKFGVDFLMGGGGNYLEYFPDNNPNYGNILNNCDVGRLIQQSYYGIDKAPYPLGSWADRTDWGYNPVQGGDKLNNKSRIIDFEITEDYIYVKARPMDWGQNNWATPSYMENTYTITEEYIKIDNRFVDFSIYTHTPGWQELPAFYTISALNNFYYYNGNSPWTNDTLIKRSDLIFWGQTNNQAFDLKSTSEFWSAWCDDSGFGVGLYVPGVYTYHAGKFGYNGSCDPRDGATNYVAPRRYVTLISGKPLEYSYLVRAGSISEIREGFKQYKGLINNSGLENYNK